MDVEFRPVAEGVRVVVNGRVSRQAYDSIDSRTVRQWSGHFACVAVRGGAECVILDGRELGRYDRVHDRALHHQDAHLAYVVGSPKGLRIVKGGSQWRGTFDDVQELTFSPSGELYASVVKRRAGGEWLTSVSAEGSHAFWHGPHYLMRDGKEVAVTSFPQSPVFWKGHGLWVSRLGEGYEPERSQIVDQRGRCPAGDARALDQPVRLELNGDVLAVFGVNYVFDDDHGRLTPYRATIEYRLRESGKGVVLEEIGGSHSAWSEG